MDAYAWATIHRDAQDRLHAGMQAAEQGRLPYLQQGPNSSSPMGGPLQYVQPSSSAFGDAREARMVIMEPTGRLAHQPRARHALMGATWAKLPRWLQRRFPIPARRRSA